MELLRLNVLITIIKYRFSKEIIDEIENTEFWDMDIEEINTFNIHTKNINELLNRIKEYKLQLRG